jgi:plasmid stabilization system protein ParE
VKRYEVELAPEAAAQVETIQAWWTENRPAAPMLFLDELTAAIEALEGAPRIGAPYPYGRIQGMRRVPLPRTRYHVYYTVGDDPPVVRIHAVWHMSRGQGPSLSS